MKTLYSILEQWADKVKPKWHPKEGLFTGDNPQEIANYLLNHSESKSQAMQRLVFYMNRAGEDCPNKTVLNKVKKLLSESILDSDFDAQVTTLDDVLNERHRWMINDDIKSLAKWMTSQRWSKKKDYYITTSTHQKKCWIESCISRIAYNAGAGAMGTCCYIKMTTGNIYYMYCPAGDKFSIVTIDCTGDDVKFSYELSERNSGGGRIAKDPNELYLGSWPGKLNDYLIERI